jgi:hypothetical protein
MTYRILIVTECAIIIIRFPHAAPGPSAIPVEFPCVPSPVNESETIRVTWGPPPKDMLNGIIRQYTVIFRRFDLSEEASIMIVPENLTSLTITN